MLDGLAGGVSSLHCENFVLKRNILDLDKENSLMMWDDVDMGLHSDIYEPVALNFA